MKNDEISILKLLSTGQQLEWPESVAARADMKQKLDNLKDQGMLNVTYTSLGTAEDIENIAYVSVSLTPEGRMTGEDRL